MLLKAQDLSFIITLSIKVYKRDRLFIIIPPPPQFTNYCNFLQLQFRGEENRENWILQRATKKDAFHYVTSLNNVPLVQGRRA